jgi:methylated-DNA-[protein]-cysteine S-methyltransferase
MTLSTNSSINKSKDYCVIAAPFGRLGIGTEMVDGSLMVSKIDYLPAKASLVSPKNQLARQVAMQCREYFKNPAAKFDLPLKPIGTVHQQRVWSCIRDIPTGKSKTYGEIAALIKSGPRAVGSACGANPFPLVTPCHRVVSAQGIGGFMKEDSPGLYRQIKIWLLEHEGVL